MGHSLQAAPLNLATGTVVILRGEGARGFQQLHPQSLMWASVFRHAREVHRASLTPTVGFPGIQA